jgi:hypothetical protein
MKMKKNILFTGLLLGFITLPACSEKGQKTLEEIFTGKPSIKSSKSDQPSDFEKLLRNNGFYEPVEIRIMEQIEKENYGPNIKPITFMGNHFYYNTPNDSSYRNNCGLYALKRLAHHLGQKDIVDKQLWYRYPDQELRNMTVELTNGYEPYRNQMETLTVEIVGRLAVEKLHIPPKYVCFVGTNKSLKEPEEWESYKKAQIKLNNPLYKS